MFHFHEIALHVAAAWRLRKILNVAAVPAPVAAELRVNGTAFGLDPAASSPTAREALRCAVLAREQVRTGRRTAHERTLWPALVAGRWSLVDAFSAGGTRYVVAYENPAEPVTLRALSSRESAVLDLALVGRSGKWIAFELQLSESAVTRALRTALRKIGVGDTADLAGVPTARFEPMEGLDVGGCLATACLTRTTMSQPGLSDAERAIVTGILSGQRIAAIALDRGTSPRTVAHQIASAYKKLGISSRRELLALLAS
jgi:DNA-binding NarL/FixJ family response regulator